MNIYNHYILIINKLVLINYDNLYHILIKWHKLINIWIKVLFQNEKWLEHNYNYYLI